MTQGCATMKFHLHRWEQAWPTCQCLWDCVQHFLRLTPADTRGGALHNCSWRNKALTDANSCKKLEITSRGFLFYVFLFLICVVLFCFPGTNVKASINQQDNDPKRVTMDWMAYFLWKTIQSVKSNLLTNSWNSPNLGAKHIAIISHKCLSICRE